MRPVGEDSDARARRRPRRVLLSAPMRCRQCRAAARGASRATCSSHLSSGARRWRCSPCCLTLLCEVRAHSGQARRGLLGAAFQPHLAEALGGGGREPLMLPDLHPDMTRRPSRAAGSGWACGRPAGAGREERANAGRARERGGAERGQGGWSGRGGREGEERERRGEQMGREGRRERGGGAGCGRLRSRAGARHTGPRRHRLGRPGFGAECGGGGGAAGGAARACRLAQ